MKAIAESEGLSGQFTAPTTVHPSLSCLTDSHSPLSGRMMRVETGSRNDMQEVSEVQRIEPFFLAPIIHDEIPGSLSTPGRIAMRRSSGSRVH